MKSVMERRNLVAGLAMLIVAIFALTGTASARLPITNGPKARRASRRATPRNVRSSRATLVVHGPG